MQRVRCVATRVVIASINTDIDILRQLHMIRAISGIHTLIQRMIDINFANTHHIRWRESHERKRWNENRETRMHWTERRCLRYHRLGLGATHKAHQLKRNKTADDDENNIQSQRAADKEMWAEHSNKITIFPSRSTPHTRTQPDEERKREKQRWFWIFCVGIYRLHLLLM